MNKPYKITHAFALARYLIHRGIRVDNDTLADFMETTYGVPCMIVDTFNPVNDNLSFIKGEYLARTKSDREVLE